MSKTPRVSIFRSFRHQFPGKDTFAPNAQRLMRAQNEFFTAGAIWQRCDGQWSCTLAAPILRWMLKLDPATAKIELARRGCSWEWVKMDTQNFGQTFFVG